jgi:class 3 adenylate cyclase
VRPVLHGDVVGAARALLAVEADARGALIRRLIAQAGWADKFRRAQGRVHPFWGDGSLEVAAACHRQMPEPYLDAPDYCECMIAVFEALLNHARK